VTTSPSHIARDSLLDIALLAAEAAGVVIRKAASSLDGLKWENKGIADFVTDVDRDAEHAITDVIHRYLPNALIIGEELTPASELAAEGIAFFVDPLDGTTNFLHGYPEYAVSIGVISNGEQVAAVVLNCASGEIFTAERGSGAFRDGYPISVSKISEPERALIGTGFPFKRPDLLDSYVKQFAAVSRATAGIRRAGSAAVDLASVACGRFDAFWELDLAPWDIAAGLLLVREAGGVITDTARKQKAPSFGSVVAGNPDLQRWLLDEVAAESSTTNQ
jgi:myo-inositol-1(or 4)-monophosphatase